MLSLLVGYYSNTVSIGNQLPVGLKVPVVDSELAATLEARWSAKLDAATARIASMEEELALLRAKNERLLLKQSAESEE